jgi:hypothetical protein
MARREKFLLHVSDWNYEDKYYRVTRELLVGFLQRLHDEKVPQDQRLRIAWKWFTDRIYTLAQRRSAYDGRRLTRVNTHELNEALFFDIPTQSKAQKKSKRS